MKKYIILLISILVFKPITTVNGCGFSLLPEEYRVYLFNQSALNKDELMPLFYSSEYFYNESYNWHDNTLPPNDESYTNTELANAKEWKEHTSYNGSLESIIDLVYRTDIDSILLPSSEFSKRNAFLKHLTKHYQPEYHYLLYAKKCELIYGSTDPWGLQSNNDNYIVDLVNEGQQQTSKKINHFLNLRYAYQLLKINFYHPHYGESVIDIYNKKIKSSPIKSWLKESAKFYYYQTNDLRDEESQYHLSLSFDKSIDKKFRCVQLFDRKNYSNIIKYTKNNHEKAIIYVMYELQNPARSLQNLERIYHLDPTNEYLVFLIAREINKMEDWLLTPELTNAQPSTFQYSDSLAKSINIKNLSNQKYINDVYRLVSHIIINNRSSSLAEFHVLASNLSILLKDKTKGYNHLALAEAHCKNDKLKFQINYNKIALHFDGKSNLNEDIKRQILNFVDFNQKNPNLIIRQATALSQLYLFIGARLLKAGDVANGILFHSKTTRPYGEIGYWITKNYHILLLEKAKPIHYDQLMALIDKQQKTTFEKFLLNRKDFMHTTIMDDRYSNDWYGYDTLSINKNKVLDYKSMYYVQQNMLDSALSCVNKIDNNYWNQYPYELFKCFPFFTGNSTDYQSNHDFYPYNKRQYLQRMVDVKYLIDNHIGDIAKHYFVLANGYFNMSYHGNYWIMNMPYKLSDEVENNYYEFPKTSNRFLENYYGCQQAEAYYLKAFEHTNDTAFAALCINKASLCNQNMQTVNWRLSNTFNEEKYEWSHELKIVPSKYKYLFTRQYQNSDFYNDFVSNCYYSYHLQKRFY